MAAHEAGALHAPGYGGVAVVPAWLRPPDDVNALGPGLWARTVTRGAGGALEGCYFSNHYAADDKSPRVQDFVNAYKAKYNNKVPDAMAALAYDATRILSDAISRAGGTDGAKIRDEIAKTANFQGVTGDITIDQDRNARKPAVVLQIQGNSYKYVTTINPL